MAQNRRFLIVCISSLALTIAFSILPVNASEPSPNSVVGQLKAVFGTPQDFIDKFEVTVKDRSDQVVGLLIAASGFVYAVRLFH